MIYIFFIIGVLTNGSEFRLSINLLSGFLIIIFWYVNATSINDISDEKIDKINLKKEKERPLIDDSENIVLVRRLAIFSAILSMILSLLMGLQVAVLVGVMLLLNYIYSMPPVRISYRGVIALLLLPLGYVLLPYLLGVFTNTGSFNTASYLILSGLYLGFIGRIALKDHRDVIGDRKFGKRTFLVRYGQKATSWFSGTFWLLGSIIIIYVFRSHILFVLISAICTLVILYSLYHLALSKGLKLQLAWITLIGRLGNIVAIGIIAVLDSINSSSAASFNITLSCLLIAGAVYCWPAIDQIKFNNSMSKNAR
ncbi:MAG: UbiA prenyltransferase family protein [bacterium]